MSFTSQFGGVHDKNNEDPEALKKAFEAYKQNAIESDLGGRSKIRQMEKNFTGLQLKKWLDTKFRLN